MIELTIPVEREREKKGIQTYEDIEYLVGESLGCNLYHTLVGKTQQQQQQNMPNKNKTKTKTIQDSNVLFFWTRVVYIVSLKNRRKS